MEKEIAGAKIQVVVDYKDGSRKMWNLEMDVSKESEEDDAFVFANTSLEGTSHRSIRIEGIATQSLIQENYKE